MFFQLVLYVPPIRALYATPTLQMLLFAAAARMRRSMFDKKQNLVECNLPTSPAHRVPCLR
jgi:hypothetical protein